jgi:hypothetical protein
VEEEEEEEEELKAEVSFFPVSFSFFEISFVDAAETQWCKLMIRLPIGS